jgi:hypothetical protein
MDNLEKKAAIIKRETEDTSVAAGNKQRLSLPVEFATPQLYKAYMSRILKNGYQVPKENLAHHDASVDEEEDLGESVSSPESPPGEAMIETQDVPAVREIARGRPTAQSSIEFGAGADRAVDGRTDNIFSQGSCTHTRTDVNPWWRVDLGKTMNIQHIEVYNRGDCCGDRLSNFQVRVGDAKVWEKNSKCGNNQQWTVAQGESVKIPCTRLQGQYVFVVVPATVPLNLCEVKVFGSDNPGANTARGMPATQSSVLRGGTADRAVDGHTNTDFKDNSCTHTEYENKPWWKVDLGKVHRIDSVQIWNRGDCCGSRLSNFEVRVGNNAGMWTVSKKCGERWAIPEGEHKTIKCNERVGQFVWVVLQERNVLTLCEVRVLTTFAKKGLNIARGKPSEQSSTGYGGLAARAVDGDVDTNYKAGSCTHTHYDQEPWWRVDVGKAQSIGAVQIWNRGDCCGARLSNFEVRVGDGQKWQGNTVCGGERQSVPQGMRKTILCEGAMGKYVYVVKRDPGYLNLCEVRVLPYKGGADEFSASEGCVAKPIGMESRVIKEGDVSASSYYGDIEEYGPNNARLNYRGSCWQPLHEKMGEWLQIVLPKEYTVTGISTQGSFEADKWVTEYKVRYFAQDKWEYVGGGEGEDFKGNVDRSSVKTNDLKKPVKTSKLRIYPLNWKGAMAMRVEIVGRSCKTPAEAPLVDASGKPLTGAAAKAVLDAKAGLECPPAPVCPKCANHKVEPVQCPGNKKACPKCPPPVQSDGRRRRSLEILAENGFGEGVARLWYAATKGAERQSIVGHSVYVSEGNDFRTEDGSIYAGKDLVAGKALRIEAWPGFGDGSAEFWFAKRARKTYKSNTLYLRSGDFTTQEGSISASDSLIAGKYLEVGAFPGFGDATAKLWYSASAHSGSKFESDTVYLEDGHFATQKGSIVSSKDVRAGRYLSLKAFPNHGEGEARFLYSAAAKAPYKSNTVYLKIGNLATQDGSIVSNNDVEVGQFLRLRSMDGYGDGEAKLWYAKDSLNGYAGDSTYLQNGDFRTQEGDIIAAKNMIAGRNVVISAFPGLGSGQATLKFAKVADTVNGLEADSLYLTSGDFRTQLGSIASAQDLEAGRAVKIKSLEGHGEGHAELVYSHTAREKFAAKTLYLKEGDFKTQKGSIRAGDTLHTSKYLEIAAFPGFGEGSVKLWHCNSDIEGFSANSLYLKNGDFRTQDGSIHASKDVVAGRYLEIQAMDGFGQGSTKLWYSAQGKDQYRSNALYLNNGDFHTEGGDIYAAGDLHAGRYLKINAWPGHGVGEAKIWHSKQEHRGFGADTLYLEEGHFQVQEGSIIASGDLHAGRFLKLGAKAGYGTGSGQLWYSGSGKEGIYPHTVYLDSGDIRTHEGSIVSAKDVIATGNIHGQNLKVAKAHVKGTVTAGHLYLGGDTAPTPSGGTTTNAPTAAPARRLLGEAKQPVEVGSLLRELAESNEALKSRNGALHTELKDVMSRIQSLEELASRR